MDRVGMIVALCRSRRGPGLATVLLGDEQMITGDDRPLDSRDLVTIEVWRDEDRALLAERHIGDCVYMKGQWCRCYGEKRLRVEHLHLCSVRSSEPYTYAEAA